MRKIMMMALMSAALMAPAGLAMAADGLHLGRRHVGSAQQLLHAAGIDVGQQVGRQGFAPYLVAPRALQRHQFAAQLGREGAIAGLQQMRPAILEFGQHAVDAVETGAGHQADEKLCAHVALSA